MSYSEEDDNRRRDSVVGSPPRDFTPTYSPPSFSPPRNKRSAQHDPQPQQDYPTRRPRGGRGKPQHGRGGGDVYIPPQHHPHGRGGGDGSDVYIPSQYRQHGRGGDDVYIPQQQQQPRDYYPAPIENVDRRDDFREEYRRRDDRREEVEDYRRREDVPERRVDIIDDYRRRYEHREEVASRHSDREEFLDIARVREDPPVLDDISMRSDSREDYVRSRHSDRRDNVSRHSDRREEVFRHSDRREISRHTDPRDLLPLHTDPRDVSLRSDPRDISRRPNPRDVSRHSHRNISRQSDYREERPRHPEHDTRSRRSYDPRDDLQPRSTYAYASPPPTEPYRPPPPSNPRELFYQHHHRARARSRSPAPFQRDIYTPQTPRDPTQRNVRLYLGPGTPYTAYQEIARYYGGATCIRMIGNGDYAFVHFHSAVAAQQCVRERDARWPPLVVREGQSDEEAMRGIRGAWIGRRA